MTWLPVRRSGRFRLQAPGHSRGFQAHVPWSDNTVYFDTAGCCDGVTQRISASLTTFPGYTGATWWDDWHHWVFFKNGSDKQVWIDGQLFLQGSSTAPLPTDMTSLWLGNSADGTIMHGQLDDFAVYATVLSPTDIQALAAGTAPNALTSNPTILAYWPFDDAPVGGEPTISLDAEGYHHLHGRAPGHRLGDWRLDRRLRGHQPLRHAHHRRHEVLSHPQLSALRH